jgi:hypothetical protein
MSITVRLSVHLTAAQALALAQFLKRIGWSEMRGCAVDEFETYLIRDALGEVQKDLARAGYEPR